MNHLLTRIHIQAYLEPPQSKIGAWVNFDLFFCLALEISPDRKFSPAEEFVRFCQDPLFRISASSSLDKRIPQK